MLPTDAPPAGRAPCPSSPDGTCDFVSLGRFPDKSGQTGPQEVVQCRNCRGAITLPPLADVAFLYANRASQDFQPDTNGMVRRIKQLAFRRQAAGLVRQLPSPAGRVLDFGCGSGLFTRCLGDRLGPDSVVGSDFHEAPPAELAGRAYHAMADLGQLTGQFDTVLAMHVLEHDDDAAGLLARIAGMARPGGQVVLEVPNIECVWTGLLGADWDAWYVPFHRTHFSPDSLQALVRAGGLTIEAVHNVTVPTMGRSIANALGVPLGLPIVLAGIALHPVQWGLEALTRRPSAVRLIARVPG